MAIYDNVKLIALKKGIGIPQLEQSAGLSNGSIGKWNKVNPRVTSVKAVADVLGVSVDTLLKDNLEVIG
ncbi:helix-turn-helix domain-containing protein [Weissella confusa]|uniref:helix-turn-helix domain-containing protein n=1 Tax=Weissella confusa TaxID=1583 RepID=UPI001C6F9105|nr:helix-turn-helix transcriptional regulator [Weissella confusa]QYU58168.1 helix-turn-helix domain-containing protein [Weissella confusa]